MAEAQVSLKESLIQTIDEMPADKIAEVLNFARFLNEKQAPAGQIVVKRGSFEEFEALAGIVSLGGDAVVDCENYWE
jgi:hypothetical protein